ncbi:RNA polymerase sigma factor [Treponema primitia]|uniref:RNA polymerase sigma factor n=1 Tax=Treponema primitia TaxID=88058 RepID=UPI003980A4C1
MVLDMVDVPNVEFQKLYSTAFPVIHRVVNYITRCEESTEDICQETFFRLYEKKMVFPNPEEAKYWLIRVAKNVALNYIKHRNRETIAYQRTFREIVQDQDGIENILQKEADRLEIRKTLENLPIHLYAVIILKEYGMLNYKEIGRVLSIKENAVKVRVYRAKKRLSYFLIKKGLACSASG